MFIAGRFDAFIVSRVDRPEKILAILLVGENFHQRPKFAIAEQSKAVSHSVSSVDMRACVQ
jgi:hypothetical protein